jgi:hypothetical protein
MTPLKEHDFVAIANLKTDPGYQNLLTLVETEVNAINDRLFNETNHLKALEILRSWQISRKLLNSLRFYPEKIAEEIRVQRETRNPEIDFIAASFGAYTENDNPSS